MRIFVLSTAPDVERDVRVGRFGVEGVDVNAVDEVPEASDANLHRSQFGAIGGRHRRHCKYRHGPTSRSTDRNSGVAGRGDLRKVLSAVPRVSDLNRQLSRVDGIIRPTPIRRDRRRGRVRDEDDRRSLRGTIRPVAVDAITRRDSAAATQPALMRVTEGPPR